MRRLLFFLMFAAVMAVTAYASESAYGLEELENALPSAAEEILGEGLGTEGDLDSALGKVWDYCRGHIRGELTAALRPASAVLAVALLASLAEGAGLKREIDYMGLASALVIASACLGDVNSVAAMAQATLAEMNEFSKLLIPTLSTIAAGSGAVSSAGVKYAATALFMDVLISLAEKLLLPVLWLYAAALVACAATGDKRLGGAVKLMKWLCKTALTLLVSAFTLYLSVAGIAASGADAAAAKTAKAAISTLVPVVGRMVADASESLVVGAGLIRSAAGVFGLVAVIALCTAPFLAMGLRYLVFKAVAAVAGLIAGERIGALTEGIAALYGMLMATVGCGAIFMFLSIISLIRTVV